jgi:hypothetical protein
MRYLRRPRRRQRDSLYLESDLLGVAADAATAMRDHDLSREQTRELAGRIADTIRVYLTEVRDERVDAFLKQPRIDCPEDARVEPSC